MRIISPGRKTDPPTWRVTCGRCGAVLEYGQKDICGDYRDGNYVVCPQCQKWISHSLGKKTPTSR